jgi:hypothetical protein
VTDVESQLRTVTPSEAMHKVLKREDCPCLMGCEAPVTRNFFTRICNSTHYLNCHHFARKMDELKSPMTWLQALAVHEEKATAKKG